MGSVAKCNAGRGQRRSREPEGNGCVERFIRTLKENLLWVHRFETTEELRLALLAFQRHYNQTGKGQPEAGDLAAFNERYDRLFPKAFGSSVSSPGSQAEVVVQ